MLVSAVMSSNLMAAIQSVKITDKFLSLVVVE